MKLAVGEVRDAGREAEAEQMAKREHMVRDASAVGVVDGDIDIGTVEEAVDDMSGFALGRRDDLGMEWSIAP